MKLLFPDLENVGAVAGAASVLGHIFPFWLKFKGGKGFASFLGMTLALILGAASLVIFHKHWENIPRMLKGTELGLRSVLKGENRVR